MLGHQFSFIMLQLNMININAQVHQLLITFVIFIQQKKWYKAHPYVNFYGFPIYIMKKLSKSFHRQNVQEVFVYILLESNKCICIPIFFFRFFFILL